MSASIGPEARLAALEAENGRLRRAVEELSILNELATTIGVARDMTEVIETITRRSMKAVRAAQGVITMLNEEDMDLTRTLVRTTTSSGDQEVFRPNDSLLGWMHIHRRPLVLNDPHNDPRFRGTRFDDAIRSFIAVPLLSHSHLIGVLTLYNKKGDEGFTAEDQRLLSILASQSAQVLETARMQEETQKLARMQEEYRLAFEIQTRLLPGAAPAVPGYDLAGASRPAQTVGGDYFDFIPAPGNRLALCVADVSGKGLPASLLMANVQATLRSQTIGMGEAVSEGIAHANRLLCRSIRKGSFVTLFYGMLDLATHRFRFVNAGHNLPYWISPGQAAEVLPSGGLVLGFLPSFNFPQHERTFAPGDLLVIYSDGITEAMNAAHEEFDEERLLALLHRHRDASAAEIVAHVFDAVEAYAGDTPQSDDMTILVARRTA